MSNEDRNEERAYLGEGYWWCPECREEVDSGRVTYSEHHEDCGRGVIWKEPLPAAGEDVWGQVAKMDQLLSLTIMAAGAEAPRGRVSPGCAQLPLDTLRNLRVLLRDLAALRSEAQGETEPGVEWFDPARHARQCDSVHHTLCCLLPNGHDGPHRHRAEEVVWPAARRDEGGGE